MLIEGTLIINECEFIGDIIDGTRMRMMMNGRGERNEASSLTDASGSSSSSVCVWESSMVSVNGSKASLLSSRSSFINSSYGAVSVYDGGEFKGEMITLMNNNPGVEHFPSMRYNIICLSNIRTSSLVNITSVNEGSDGEKKNTSLWINALDNCALAGIASTYSSAFFISHITSLDISRVGVKEGAGGLLSLNGDCFIPCNLSCTIIADKMTFTIDLAPVNESAVEVRLNEATLIVLEQAENIRVAMNSEKREAMEESEVSATNLSIWTNPVQTRESQESGDGSGITVAVVLIVIVFILFIGLLIIIVLLFLLHMRFKTQLNQNVVNPESDVQLNESKDDEAAVQQAVEMEEIEATVTHPIDTSCNQTSSHPSSDTHPLSDSPPSTASLPPKKGSAVIDDSTLLSSTTQVVWSSSENETGNSQSPLGEEEEEKEGEESKRDNSNSILIADSEVKNLIEDQTSTKENSQEEDAEPQAVNEKKKKKKKKKHAQPDKITDNQAN